MLSLWYIFPFFNMTFLENIGWLSTHTSGYDKRTRLLNIGNYFLLALKSCFTSIAVKSWHYRNVKQIGFSKPYFSMGKIRKGAASDVYILKYTFNHSILYRPFLVTICCAVSVVVQSAVKNEPFEKNISRWPCEKDFLFPVPWTPPPLRCPAPCWGGGSILPPA